MHECQIYALYSKDGIIDYIGRSSRHIKKRMQEHKYVLGFMPQYKVIDKCSINCREVEKRWIEHYRVLGCVLRNISYGQGPHFCAESTRQKLSRKFTGRPVTWGEKISKAQSGVARNWSKEGKEKVAATQFKKGVSNYHLLSEEQKERHRRAAKKSWDDPEKRKRMSSGFAKGRWDALSDESKKKRAQKQSRTLKSNPRLKEIASNGAKALLAKDPDNMKRRITKFWEEIRKDPVRYREYIDNRTASIARAKNAKK